MNLKRDAVCQSGSVTSIQQLLIIGAISLRMVMGGIDGSILSLGISSIVCDFGGDNASFLFLVEGVMFASSLIFFGRIGDQIGLKRIFLLGVICFTLGSGLSSVAGSMTGLILSRIISSVGLAMSLAVSLPIIMVFIPEQNRGRSIGYTVMGMSIGSVIGPVICGSILDYLGWEPMFLVLVPIGLIILVIGGIGIPENTCKPIRIAYDYPGFFLIFLTLGMFCIGMNLGILDRNPLVFADALLVTIIAGATFVFWERRIRDPLIDLSFLCRWSMLVPLFLMFCIYCVYRVSFYFLPIYLSEILKMSSLTAGLVISIGAIIPALGSPFTGYFIEKAGEKGIQYLLVISGLFGILSSMCMIGTEYIGAANAVYLSLLFLGIMFTLGYTSVTSYYYSLVSLDKAGMAGGVIETVTEFSALMAISFVQLFFVAGMTLAFGGTISAREIVSESIPGIQSIYLFTLFLSLGIILLAIKIRVRSPVTPS